MKRIATILLSGTAVLFLSACGGGSSGSSTPVAPPNNNVYNLRAVNLAAPLSIMVKGGYSNGTTGSLFLYKDTYGTDTLDGTPVTIMGSDVSITLDNGYTSQGSSFALIDNNGFTRAFDDTSAYCTLRTAPQVVPTDAKIGATSSATSIYDCDNNTMRTMSWSLTDAGNGNAYYTFDTVVTGAIQSENTGTYTITPASSPIYYKLDVNLIAQGITGSFEGEVSY